MKKALLFGYVVFLLCITVIPVSATPQSRSRNLFNCSIQNAPENASYADILIKINPKSRSYIAFNDKINSFSADSEIVVYNQDGYMSLSFHYKNLDKGGMEIASPWFYLNDSKLSMDKVSTTIKVVLLDKAGNILHISDEINIKPEKSKFAYALTYDVIQKTAKIEFDDLNKNSFALLYYLILIRIALAAAIATLLAIPLKLRPIWKAPLVTLASQAAYIIILIIFLLSGMCHLLLLIVGEAFVLFSALVVYIVIFEKSLKWKFAVATFAANTISLLMVFLIFIIKALVQMSYMISP